MSLIKTYLQDIRVDHPSNLDRDELRVTQTGLLTAVLEMTNSANGILSPDFKAKALVSQGRNLDVPVTQKGNVTIKNVRSCDVQCGQNTSDLVRVIWKTVVADICMVPGQYVKNHISYMFDLAQKLSDVAEAFRVEIENDLDTAFDANKTQIYGSSIVGDTYAFPAGALQVQEADLDFFFGDLPAIQFADDFTNPTIKIIANHRVMPVVDRLFNQGAGNNQNLNYQFAGKDFRFSNRITNGTGVKATGYFMSEDSMGLLTRVDVDAMEGHTAGDGTEWIMDTIPGIPFPVGIKYNSKCSDQSALEANGLEHLTATKIEHWQISFDYAIVTPYNSDPATKAGAIRKFEFV